MITGPRKCLLRILAITPCSVILLSIILWSDMKNPFQFGRELGLGSLVDRQKELAAIEQSIRDSNKLFLIGPRRFGKTSILKTVADRLSSKSAVILRLDAESYSTIDMLVAAIVSESAKALKVGVKRVGEQIQNVFSILRPELD